MRLRRRFIFSICLLPVALPWARATPRAAQDLPTRLVAAARAQIGVTTQYAGTYQPIAYPGGDVAAHTGVCTDVIIRAYRQLGVDLQVLVHQDMRAAWAAYPKIWGLKRPDPNIDHRRVPNLAVFFRRQQSALPPPSPASSTQSSAYQAGDLVTWMLPGNLPHIGVVSDRKQGAVPLMLHNIGQGTQEENILFAYPITGHYRYAMAGRRPPA